jgi:hypothetical protein
MTDEQTQAEPQEGDGAATSPTTTLEALRAEFAHEVAPKSLLKRLPRFGKKLVAEFGVASKDTVRQGAEQENDEYILAQCVRRILFEDKTSPSADANGLVPIGEYFGRPELDPVKFDGRLCEILGIQHETYKETELAVYEDNDLLIAAHAGEIAEWSLDTSKQAYSDFPSAA